MSEVLYRKYRPALFSDITNQRAIVTTLTNQLVLARTAHAYCFSGPRGVGKTTVARIFAKALNCTTRPTDSPEPCGTCLSCTEMTQGSSLDLIEVDAASHTGVDHVRDSIIAATRVATAGGKYKVFIIDEVHMLSISAFNALLKTLEEPPEHAIFILATTEIHKVPATILSRCQRFQFTRIAHDEMLERLTRLVKSESRVVAPEVLNEVAVRSEGSLRDAETMLGQVLALVEKGEVTMDLASLVIPRTTESDILRFGQHVVGNDAAAAIKDLVQFSQEGGEPLRLLEGLIDLLRDALTLAIVGSDVLPKRWSKSRSETLAALAKQSPQRLLSILDTLIRRRSMVIDAVSPELIVEMAFVESILGLQPAPIPLGADGVKELLKN